MANLLQAYENKQIARLSEGKSVPDFQAGDTVRVNVWIVEGKNKRVQAFEGLCIARKNKGINSSFTVRKISNGEGVERVFSTYSPLIDSIEVVRRGVVRRAKLYYMRKLTGKAARIREKLDFDKKPKSSTKKSDDKKAKKESKAQTEGSKVEDKQQDSKES